MGSAERAEGHIFLRYSTGETTTVCNFWISNHTYAHQCPPHSFPCCIQRSVSLSKNLAPVTNVPPCQRQRCFKTAGFGRLYHFQAIFQPIHLARIIVSLPFNAWRSDQLSQATSSIVNKTGNGRTRLRGRIKKERRMERRVKEKWVC